jgi:hypothetical protein
VWIPGEAERAGQLVARGRILDLVRVAWAPGQRSSVEKVCFWLSIIIQKCVLIMGLTGVSGARPTGRSYTCKHAFCYTWYSLCQKGLCFKVDMLYVIIGALYIKGGCVLRQVRIL